MGQTEILLPKMGESVAEATIIKWLKNEGEFVKADEPLVEIATDKVDSEVPSTSEGILIKQLCKEGDVIQVGKPIALISNDSTVKITASLPKEKTSITISETPATIVQAKTVLINGNGKLSNSTKFYSPLVKNIAKTEGVSELELEAISGTGLLGRITKKDILGYLPNRKNSQTVVKKSEIKISEPKPVYMSAGANDEIIEMDRMRKLIAEHMVMSKRVSPHVTSFVEADVTGLVMWREKIKKEFEY